MSVFIRAKAYCFFTKGDDVVRNGKTKTIFKCNSEAIINRKCVTAHNSFSCSHGAGYTNLKVHLDKCYEGHNYESLYAIHDQKFGGNKITSFINVDKTSANIYGHLDQVISQNLPFSFVAQEVNRKYSTLSPISKNTLLKYMDAVGWEVRGILIEKLPKKIALMADGWDSGDQTNYLNDK